MIYSLKQWDWLCDYFTQMTDGVKDRETAGQPFATKETPWNWTKQITTDAIEEASVYLVYEQYRTENGGGGASIAYGSLQSRALSELLEILHQIPEEAFLPGEDMGGDLYSQLYTSLGDRGSAVYFRDPVNSMGVVIRNTPEGVGIALCDDWEKVMGKDTVLADSVRYWEVSDGALHSFMNNLLEKSAVVVYAMGSEYRWQEPLEFARDDFTMNLRLIEGWEYEMVEDTSQEMNYGIRCRPEGISGGWIYFSFWPDGYHPQETDRYYSEGSRGDYPTQTSYPSSVKTSNGLNLTDGIWSYYVRHMEAGDFAVINQEADSWFLQYKDAITDIMAWCEVAAAE